jgi:hypothetical protein
VYAVIVGDNEGGMEGVDAAVRGTMRGVWEAMVAHLKRVAGTHVRNSATVVGNLVLALQRGLPSDVATLMLAAGKCVCVLCSVLCVCWYVCRYVRVFCVVLKVQVVCCVYC